MTGTDAASLARVRRAFGGAALLHATAFQAGYIPVWRESCESYALSAVAAFSGWLLLLSQLLSAAVSWNCLTLALLASEEDPEVGGAFGPLSLGGPDEFSTYRT